LLFITVYFCFPHFTSLPETSHFVLRWLYYEVPERTLVFRLSFLAGMGLEFDRARAPMTATEAEDFGRWVADLILSPPRAQTSVPDPTDQAPEL